MQINLFGTNISLKENLCSLNGKQSESISYPYVNLYVNLTNSCMSDCSFCINKSNKNLNIDFDFYKFYYITDIINKKIKINKIAFSGGEPLYVPNLLKTCLTSVKQINNNIFTVINTNGYNLETLEEYINYIDNIALSRHHYKDNIIKEIFKINDKDYLTNERLNDLDFKDKIHLRCNLIKGYVDNELEVEKYLKYANKLEIYDTGFVSLMQCNKYTKEKFINISNIDFNSIENLKLTHEWSYEDICNCKNYHYILRDNKTKMYIRYNSDKTTSEGVLVFDGQYLRYGFNGPIII